MKQAQFAIATLQGPVTAHGWRLTAHIGAHVRDDGYWSLTHLPTGCRVSRHRSLEACLRSAERIERRCGEALASANVVTVAWAISPRLAARVHGRREVAV